jgi:plasmid replication initiation protein
MIVSETPNTVEKEADRPALLPVRHPNHDLFVCDVFDAIPKDDLASMEHPVFSLATRPDTRILNYEHRNVKIQITPSVKGLATIFDKDLLIYCVSQVMAKKNQGKPIAQTVQLQAHDLLVWTNRETSGDGYRRMVEAFERLGGTRITTNIKADGEEITNGFGLIDSFRVVRETPTGRMSEVQVRLSDWMFKIIQGSEVLTLSRDYFRLRKPIERRIYEIARKHCGEQDEWRISLELLQKKTGASSHGRAFKAMVRELIEHDHLPDYSISLAGDLVVFSNRAALADKVPEDAFPQLNAETYNDAKIVAPGYDVYYLEQEWRNFWVDSGMPELRSPDKAFVAFCKSRAKRKPMQPALPVQD